MQITSPGDPRPVTLSPTLIGRDTTETMLLASTVTSPPVSHLTLTHRAPGLCRPSECSFPLPPLCSTPVPRPPRHLLGKPWLRRLDAFVPILKARSTTRRHLRLRTNWWGPARWRSRPVPRRLNASHWGDADRSTRRQSHLFSPPLAKCNLTRAWLRSAHGFSLECMAPIWHRIAPVSNQCHGGKWRSREESNTLSPW